MENTIKIACLGKIISGDECGNYIKINDDSEDSGGFLILTSEHADFNSGFDAWVENFEELARYFKESSWVVEWIDP